MNYVSMVSELSFIFNYNPELDNNYGTQDANYRGDYC